MSQALSRPVYRWHYEYQSINQSSQAVTLKQLSSQSVKKMKPPLVAKQGSKRDRSRHPGVLQVSGRDGCQHGRCGVYDFHHQLLGQQIPCRKQHFSRESVREREVGWNLMGRERGRGGRGVGRGTEGEGREKKDKERERQ